MGQPYRSEFTESLEAVARGLRRLDEIEDPALRDAVAAALGLAPGAGGLDPSRRAFMRRRIVAAAPLRPRLSDRLYAVLAVLAAPAPYAVRAFAVAVVAGGLLASATVASADSLPDEPLYALKVAAEQLRLVVAATPEDRAAVELSLAEHRLAEAEALASAGKESAALIATTEYGARLANAAAELAQVEISGTRSAGIVAQVEAKLSAQQERTAATATRLVNDPKTELAGVVLHAALSTAVPGGGSRGARIADAASQVSQRLAAVAEQRAEGAQPLTKALPEVRRELNAKESARIARPTRTPERTSAPAAAAATRRPEPTRPATAAPTVRPTATPRATDTARPTQTPRATPTVRPTPAATATIDPAAKQAAERAKQAAQNAKQAADKARDTAKRTPTPPPARR